MTRYTFEHAEARIIWRGPYAVVEVRRRVPKGKREPPWKEIAKLDHEPTMGAVQHALRTLGLDEPADA